MIEIEGDSAEYEYIAYGVELAKEVDGFCIEIGLRRGMGTKTIIDAVLAHCPHKTVIAVDPYGSIEYNHREGQCVRMDYTNQMHKECLSSIYAYLLDKPIGFLYFKMEDTVFFETFKYGIYEYETTKTLCNTYSTVHFDGPHTVQDLFEEIKFFNERTSVGGTWIFDDITDDFYPHDSEVEPYLFHLGYELIIKGNKKALYQKK